MDGKLDVLFWAAIKPIKSGTFEDYVLSLASACMSAGYSIKFVLRAPIDPEVKTRFDDAGLDYDLLEKPQHSSGRTLAKYLRQRKPRILHVHFYGAGSPLLIWARLTSRVKIVLHDHNSRPVITSLQSNQSSMLGELQFFKRSLLGLFVDQIIAVSDFLAKQIQQEMHLSPKKIRVIYNGVDIDRFHLAEDSEAGQDMARLIFGKKIQDPVVTFVGMLSDEKGVDVLLESIRNLSAAGVKAHYVIVGDGPMRKDVEKAVAETGGNNISYLGLRNDVNRILQASDIFVAPHKWEEAFGLTLIEAAASSLPIIASDVGAIAEVIGEDEGGVRITPDDNKSLEEAIKHLVSDENLRKKLGMLARKRTERLYSLDKMVCETLDLYR